MYIQHDYVMSAILNGYEQPTAMGSFNDHWVMKRKLTYCVRFGSAPKNPSHTAWLSLHSDTATYMFRIRTQYSHKINFRCMQSKAESGSNKIDCVVKCTTCCCIEGIALNRISMRYDEEAIKETTTAVLCRMLIFRIRHQSVHPCTTVQLLARDTRVYTVNN